MQTVTSIRRFGATLKALGLATALAASSAGAAIVWDLNPQNQDGVTLGPSQNFTEQGFTITARGFDDSDRNGIGTPTNLYFKNRPPSGGAGESGLGLAVSPHNEVNGSATGPANFIQLDLRSILQQGATNGQIAVTSLQNGESFQLFGSNAEGQLGIAISGLFTGLAFDDRFVAIPQFGAFSFISITGAGNGSNVLPSRFAADITPIPEIGTMMPIVGLLVAIGATHVLRRRRASALGA
ncbi:MAG TPA: hypothetical protein VK993_04895 [Chthoniobacterales bacterium]|nr:hypothetical protein [Chthoniobacterales bacterium]